MQHDDLADPYGFWTDDKPTRQVQRTRIHGDTQMLPVVRTRSGKIPSPVRRRNPLMTRLLMMVGSGLLVVPAAFAFRTDRPDRSAGPKAVDPVLLGTMPPSPTDLTLAVDTEAPTTTLAASTAAPTDPPTTVAPTVEPTAPLTEAPTTAASKKKATPKPTTPPASVAAAAQAAPQPAACSATYTIVAGDTWSGIASRAKVSMNTLLAANGATINTVLLPGKKVCLPNGAQQPAPPTTKPAATTTQPPATTQPKPATTTTTQPPATTAPGTTQPAPPPNTYTKAQVTQIIRDVWPDDLENAAIAIATRESNLIPTVRNYCCYGLFQIYFNANKAFLASVGVTSAAQLYDPTVNATAAYAMYRHSGWAPWGGDPTATTTTTTVAP